MEADGGDMPARMKASLGLLFLGLFLALRPIKQPRTRQASRFDEFYSRMRDDEFRATFRVPRPLFNVIVEDMRESLTYECVLHDCRICARFPAFCAHSALWCTVVPAMQHVLQPNVASAVGGRYRHVHNGNLVTDSRALSLLPLLMRRLLKQQGGSSCQSVRREQGRKLPLQAGHRRDVQDVRRTVWHVHVLCFEVF
jgi:hypothetical protein